MVGQAVAAKMVVMGQDSSGAGSELLHLGRSFADVLVTGGFGPADEGEALGLGLVAAMRLSGAVGACEPSLVNTVEKLIDRLGLPTILPAPVDVDATVEAIDLATRRRHGGRRFVLLAGIGRPILSAEVSNDTLRLIMASLQP